MLSSQVLLTKQDPHGSAELTLSISGGSSGIGLATVELLGSLGATVVSADIQPPPAPGPFVFIKTDVSQWKSLTKLFKSTISAHGHIDFVFANAGIGPRANYLALETDAAGELQEPNTATLDVNLHSVINTATLAVHYMKSQKEGGSIVLMGSSTSLHPVRAIDYCKPPPHIFLPFLDLTQQQQQPSPAFWASAAVSLFYSVLLPCPFVSTVLRPVGQQHRSCLISVRC